MSAVWNRRRQGLLIVAVISVAVWWYLTAYQVVLKNSQWLSGWILVGLMTLLVLYNARKKISFLPMGNNAIWLQIHGYTGLVTFAIFLMHISWRWPSGYIEMALSAVFVLICVSGVVGVLMSRRFSRQLTHQGEQLLFERISGFSKKLKDAAEDVVNKSIESTESTTLGDFYARNLAVFFNRPNFSIKHLFESNHRYNRLLNELHAHERYMNAQEQEFSEQMGVLLNQKNQLDHQYALQAALKSWLFVHIPLSYSLVLILLAHIVLVYGFGAV